MAVASPVLAAEKAKTDKFKQHAVQRTALEVQQLSAGYGQRRAIDNITVRIAAGKRVGLIGPNGAGKSTLFKAVVGLLPSMSGRIYINGESDQQARQEAAYVPQFEDVDWEFPVTVLDVVLMGLARKVGWLRLPNRQHRALALQALERVGLAEYSRRQIGELSGGQKRRVFIARALVQGANILLLDEPFSGVDVVAQEYLFQVLDRLHDDGVTIVLATHDLSLATTHFDELLILNRRLIAYGEPADVFRPDILTQAFSGQLAVWRDDHQIIMLTDQHN